MESDASSRRLLGNAPIRSKVLAILIVPIAAVLLFAALQISTSVTEARSAEQVQSLAKLGVKVSALAHELQQERGKAASMLGQAVPSDEFTFESQYRSTDSAISDYRDEMAALSGEATQPVLDGLGRVDDQLKNLTGLRGSIVERKVPQAAAAFRYTTLITDLLDINEAIADATDNRAIADRVRATAAFSRLKEHVSQEEAILFEVLSQDSFRPGQYRDFINSLANQEAALVQFAATATPEQREQMDKTLTRSLVEESTQLEARAIRGETAKNLGIDPRAWFSAMTKKINLLRQVEIELGRIVVEVSGQLRQEALREALIQSGLVLLTFIIAMTISLVVARSMVRPLTRLRSAALEVANHSLPEVVRRLRDEEEQAPDFAGARGQDPGEAPSLDPMEFRSNDEIGQVARAFNAVHLEAVRVATEQAQLRRSVSTMFVNLSRRSQLLVDRLIRLIDNLEQGEQDPDRLADLFKLDHLATRMRRNDENLLVLAGSDAGRRWNQPASLVDVLRAATAEVEQYTRVRLGNVDDSIEVSAKAVNDMVHLVAELLENATSFSSPRTDVVIDARLAGEQAIIEIEDQGIGMSRQQMEELNERLAKPPVFDVTVSRMMGLFVVGRLSSRHNVSVSLRGAASGGTLAIVTLSADVLTEARPPRISNSPLEHPTQPVMAPQRFESERMDDNHLRPDLASKDEPRAIPTIDSTVVHSSSLPALPTRPSTPSGLPTRPVDTPGAPIRAISSRPTALPPAASATESATGQYFQLGPIDEPGGAPTSSAAASSGTAQSSASPGAAPASGAPAGASPPPLAKRPVPAPDSAQPATRSLDLGKPSTQIPGIAAESGKPSLGVSSAAAAMAVLRGAQPTSGAEPPPLFGDTGAADPQKPPAAPSAGARGPVFTAPGAPTAARAGTTAASGAAASGAATSGAGSTAGAGGAAESGQPSVPVSAAASQSLLTGPSSMSGMMDPTVEMPLPIFDAIESEWFRSSGHTQLLEPSSPVATPVTPMAAVDPGRSPGQTVPAQAPGGFAAASPAASSLGGSSAPAAGAGRPGSAAAAAAAGRVAATASGSYPTAPGGSSASSGGSWSTPGGPWSAPGGPSGSPPGATPPSQRPATQPERPAADARPNISVSGRAVPPEPEHLREPAAPTRASSADAAHGQWAQPAQPGSEASSGQSSPFSTPSALDFPSGSDFSSGSDFPPGNGKPTVTVPPVPPVPTTKPASTAPATPGEQPGSGWSSPADAGWKAAQAAAEAKADATTGSGLPKRVPMAHFVPGRVEQPSQRRTPRPTAHRSPDAVRGVLSSYRHGLEQGRQASRSTHSAAKERDDEQEEM